VEAFGVRFASPFGLGPDVDTDGRAVSALPFSALVDLGPGTSAHVCGAGGSHPMLVEGKDGAADVGTPLLKVGRLLRDGPPSGGVDPPISLRLHWRVL
jgi:hypothetical protein